MHFCADELIAIMMALPFLRVAGLKLSAWWHGRKHRCCKQHHKEAP